MFLKRIAISSLDIMDLETVREYLLLPPRTSASEVMLDAVVTWDTGALYILVTVIELRVNRWSRRTLVEVLPEGEEEEPKHPLYEQQLTLGNHILPSKKLGVLQNGKQ